MDEQKNNALSQAIELFDQQKYPEAFQAFVKLYRQSPDPAERQTVFQILEEAYYLPNAKEMQNNYEENCKQLEAYPYCQGVSPKSWEKLSVQIFPVSDEQYCIYDKNSRDFSELYPDKEKKKTYLFQNLDQPLFRENDCDEQRLRFLWDNVRRSEDYGADNHIYLYYSDFTVLTPLLMLCPLTPLLEGEKFVFLVGESNKKCYPMDFKKKFGIDYKAKGPQPVRLEEIKRLNVFYFSSTHSGNALVDSLLDDHPNLLTVKEFGMSGFSTFYENCLAGQSVSSFLNNLVVHQKEEAYRFIFTFFCKIYPAAESKLPESSVFFNKLQQVLAHVEIPTKAQWFAALYLANAQALDRDLNARIAPAIFHAPHYVWNCNYEVEMEKNQDVYRSFPYVKVFMSIREPAFKIAGEIKYELKCRELYQLAPHDPLEMVFFSSDTVWKYQDWRRIYYDDHALFAWEQMAVVRYEDIKRYPKETLSALCEFLDIPWADTLMYCSYNGARTIYNDAGTVINDFDLSPLNPEYYKKYFNDFDRFRVELLYQEFYALWGYKPPCSIGVSYSGAEWKALFSLPFEFEGLSAQWDRQYAKRRDKILQSLDRLLITLREQKEKIRSGEVIPVQMLRPEQVPE